MGEEKGKRSTGKRPTDPDLSSPSPSYSPLTSASDRGGKKSRQEKPSTMRLCVEVTSFNPKFDSIDTWLPLVETVARNYDWTDRMLIHQVINKLSGAAKMWYNAFILSGRHCNAWNWRDWRKVLGKTFKPNRNIYSLLRNLLLARPTDGQRLEEFYYRQIAKIWSIRLPMTEKDIINIVIGTMDNKDVYAAYYARQIKHPEDIQVFVEGMVYNEPRRWRPPAAAERSQLVLKCRCGRSNVTIV